MISQLPAVRSVLSVPYVMPGLKWCATRNLNNSCPCSRFLMGHDMEACKTYLSKIARCMRRNRGRSRLMVTSVIRCNGHSTWSTNYLLWALVMEIKALSFVFHFLPRTRRASRWWLSILFLGTRIWETSCGPVSWPQLLPCRVLARILWSWWSRLKMRGTYPESWCNEKVCYHTRWALCWACTALGRYNRDIQDIKADACTRLYKRPVAVVVTCC